VKIGILIWKGLKYDGSARDLEGCTMPKDML